MIQSYPLDWPQGYARYPYQRGKARFKTPSLYAAVQSVLEQVRLLKGKHRLAEGECIISSNVPLRNDGLPRADYMRTQIKDVGVAVYFEHNKDKVVLCCDQWNTVEQNVRAIAITIEDIRRIERNGVSDFIKRSFTGFKALPAGPLHNWWTVLGISASGPNGKPDPTHFNFDAAKACFRTLSKKYHPDSGEVPNPKLFQEVVEAWATARLYFGYES
jgi:hypothetical protein